LVWDLCIFLWSIAWNQGIRNPQIGSELRQVEADQKKFATAGSDLQSITHIQTRSSAINFVPSTSVTYLKDSDFALNNFLSRDDKTCPNASAHKILPT